MNLRVPGSINSQAYFHWPPSIAPKNLKAIAVGVPSTFAVPD